MQMIYISGRYLIWQTLRTQIKAPHVTCGISLGSALFQRFKQIQASGRVLLHQTEWKKDKNTSTKHLKQHYYKCSIQKKIFLQYLFQSMPFQNGHELCKHWYCVRNLTWATEGTLNFNVIDNKQFPLLHHI